MALTGVDHPLPTPYPEVSILGRRGPVRRLPPLPQKRNGLFERRERIAYLAAERIAVPFGLTAPESSTARPPESRSRVATDAASRFG